MRKSLHIGLNCVDPAAYGGWPGQLVGCCADARSLAGLAARAGFEASALLNDQASRGMVRGRLAELAGQMVTGDELMLSYSGHGGQYGLPLARYETLCLFDGQLADSALLGVLGEFRPGVRIVVALDSCHAGGMDRGGRVKAAPAWVTERSLVSAGYRADKAIQAAVVFLEACQAEETAMDGANGAFTGSLMQCASTGVSWREWFEETRCYMAKEFPRQHPRLAVVGEDFGGRKVFA